MNHSAPSAETAEDAPLFDGYEPPAVSPDSGPVKWTEADLIARLRARYSKKYTNGAHETLRYVGAAHVRHGPLDPSRIADFIVLDTWGNYGEKTERHPLLGFEIKVSRSDYLHEIKNLHKSEPFRVLCQQWFMVVSDPAIVRGDLPDGWGLMVPRGNGLAIKRPAAKNRAPEPMPRPFIAGFMRAAVTQAGGA